MKCPECGYISFPDVVQCRNCGYRFVHAENEEAARAESSDLAGKAGILAASAAASGAGPPIAGAAPNIKRPPFDLTLSTKLCEPVLNAPRQPGAEPEWASELSERVASFKRRRAIAREEAGQEAFQFDLEPRPDVAGRSTAGRESLGKDALDHVFERRSKPVDLEFVPFETPSFTARVAPQSDLKAGLSPSKPKAIEFPEAGFSAANQMQESAYVEVVSAPIGRRFMAGIIDALVLIAAGVVFSVLFAVVGGRLTRQPGDLVILAFIAGFWIFAYFALFSAMSFATPGQAAVGLSVRTLDGELPRHTESLLRGFGYLVSIASLMLGFLWAAMDGDGLAWHDHISGTLLVED